MSSSDESTESNYEHTETDVEETEDEYESEADQYDEKSSQDDKQVEKKPAHKKRKKSKSADATEKTEPISGGAVHKLPDYDADTLQYEKVTLQADLRWKGINFRSEPTKKFIWCGPEKPSRLILDNLEGAIPAGSLVAVMGPSGAGKTTLMDILATKLKASDGKVAINNKLVSPNRPFVSQAYVKQEDVLMDTLSTKELLRFSARLRLPKDMRLSEKYARVDAVIKELGLTKCQKTKIGNKAEGNAGLSGGERKRASVAIELLTDPSILFLDEPTTGLDSETSYHLIKTLEKIAKSGRTVISTIHQPSSDTFAVFNYLLLIVDGNIAFLGKREDAVAHFNSLGFTCPKYTNPADFFLKILQEDEKKPVIIKAWKKKVKKQQKQKDEPINIGSDGKWPKKKSHYQASMLTQLRLLTFRAFVGNIRNPLKTGARLVQMVVLGLLFGFAYFQLDNDQASIQDRVGVLTFSLITAVMSSMMNSIYSFPPEKEILIREYSSSTYSLFPYFVSKVIADAPFTIVFNIIYLLLSYFAIGFQLDVISILYFGLTMIIVALISEGIGIFAASATDDVNFASSLAPMLVMPFILYGGLFQNSETAPVYFSWIQDISYVRYAFEIITVQEFTGLTFTCDDPIITIDNTTSCPTDTGEQTIAFYGFSTGNEGRNFGILVGILIFWRLTAFLLLWNRMRKVK